MKVSRVGNVQEESKVGSSSLDLYTFNLRLDEEEAKEVSEKSSDLFLSSTQTPYVATPESDMTVDQVDELLEELKELKSQQQNTVSSRMLEGSSLYDSQISQLPRRTSF